MIIHSDAIILTAIRTHFPALTKLDSTAHMDFLFSREVISLSEMDVIEQAEEADHKGVKSTILIH